MYTFWDFTIAKTILIIYITKLFQSEINLQKLAFESLLV